MTISYNVKKSVYSLSRYKYTLPSKYLSRQHCMSKECDLFTVVPSEDLIKDLQECERWTRVCQILYVQMHQAGPVVG